MFLANIKKTITRIFFLVICFSFTLIIEQVIAYLLLPRYSQTA
jgi:phage shock protein PspC (stress-responsive transcriptional regulator)